MLRSTFIHADGVGAALEARLWRQGARSWDDFRRLRRAGLLGGGRMDRIETLVEESEGAVARRDAGFFDRKLATADRWRLLDEFAGEMALLDIETTGLVAGFDQVTAVGIGDRQGVRVFLRGRDLAEVPRALAAYRLVVTFNGARFDLPFLRATFPGMRFPAHVDLMYPLARLGYRGGLKRVEQAIGLIRPDGIAGLDGFDAVRLWREWQRGDAGSLELLVEYLRADVAGLGPLSAVVAGEMPGRIGFDLRAG